MKKSLILIAQDVPLTVLPSMLESITRLVKKAKLSLVRNYVSVLRPSYVHVVMVMENPTQKEAALKNLIEEHEEYGRIVIFAGFMGSIDRCTAIVSRQKWKY